MLPNNLTAAQISTSGHNNVQQAVPGSNNITAVKPANRLGSMIVQKNVSNSSLHPHLAKQTKIYEHNPHVLSGSDSALGQDNKHIDELLRLIEQIQQTLVPLQCVLETRAISLEMHRLTERLAKEAKRIKQLIDDGILPLK